MAEYSGFFNAELVNGEYDRTYLAETFAKYFSLFVANGVFPNPSDGIQVFENTTPDMNVLVHPGYGWINGYWYQLDNNHTLAIDPADGVLNRIDRIVVRWDLEEREVYLTVLKGTPASSPSAPEIVRSADYYDLCVAEITVDAGITQIRQSMITDTRTNSDLCGIVTGVVQSIDTTTLFNQYQAALSEFEETKLEEFDEWSTEQQQAFNDWFANIQDILDENTAGNLLNLINQETANRQTADTALETKIANNTGINATATHEGTTVSITAPTGVSIITFLAPSDWVEGETYTVNSETVELVDLNGEAVEDAWKQGSPVTLTLSEAKAFFKAGGGRYKPTDLPPLNPNFKMEITEGDTEDTVTVTADKLVISPNTDMLAGGQWEYGTELSTAPGEGQNIKHWTREQLVTSDKPFDGLLLGDVTASDAVNETILWLPENQNGSVVLSPYVVLDTNYQNGVIVTNKSGNSAWRGAWGSTVRYIGSTIESWCNTTFLNSILHQSVVSQVMECTVTTTFEGDTTGKCWPLSAKELGSPTTIASDPGTTFPYFSSETHRQSYGLNYWTRTSAATRNAYFINANGNSQSTPSTDAAPYYRVAFVLPKDFQIQQRPDGSYTAWTGESGLIWSDLMVSNEVTETVVNILEPKTGMVPTIYLSDNFNESDALLLLRKDVLNTAAIGNRYEIGGGDGDQYSKSSTYAKIQSWAENDVDPKIIAKKVMTTIKQRSVYYKGGSNVYAITSCEAYAFELGNDELGFAAFSEGVCGTKLPYFSSNTRRIAKLNGTAKSYNTRDTNVRSMTSSDSWFIVSAGGARTTTTSAANVRPCILISKEFRFNRLADGTYDLVPEDPALSAQSISTMAESSESVQLSQIIEGSILKIKENETDVDFYVAKHDYESDLNGAGRTLVVRKDVYDRRQWHGSNVNAWANCAMRSWLNSTYKALLDADIQEAMGTTTYRYTPGNGNNTVTTRSDAVFLLSLTELGRSHTYAKVEGSALPIASTLQIAYQNGSPTYQWTRSPGTNGTDYAWWLDSGGSVGGNDCTYVRGSRPAFTLPGDSYAAANDDGTYTFVGVDDPSPTVSFTFTVPHGTQPVVRQYTYNYEEHYQTMLEGGVLPPLVDEGPTYSEVLSENTWAQIAQAVADKDPILDVWQIGDTKDEVIAGETLTFAIMGKNMDDLADGSGKAGLTFGMTQLMANTRQMNSSNTNAGSFAGSAMYSWLSGTIYPNLPTELKDVIKAVNKKTSSGGGSSAIRTDAMYLWLFAEIEVFGSTTYSYAGEGTQYPYFATSAERIKRLSNGAGAASYWWERSPCSGTRNPFCAVTTSGAAGYNFGGVASYAVCFGFCI